MKIFLLTGNSYSIDRRSRCHIGIMRNRFFLRKLAFVQISGVKIANGDSEFSFSRVKSGIYRRGGGGDVERLLFFLVLLELEEFSLFLLREFVT